MPTYINPGVYIEELPNSSRNIIGVTTSIAAFIGRARIGPLCEPVPINSYSDFERTFGGLWTSSPMTFAVNDYFKNGGKEALIVRVGSGQAEDDTVEIIETPIINNKDVEMVLDALNRVDLFNILCIPPLYENIDINQNLISAAAMYCEKRRAILILDCPRTWVTSQDAICGMKNSTYSLGTDSKNAAVYFPRIQMPNPLRNNKIETFAACGAIAGVFARTDLEHGVWKAPAGVNAILNGVTDLLVAVTNEKNDELNKLGCNCLRVFPSTGPVVWGARTLQGSEWKYLPVRRLALFIEESLYRGTQWAVFEPNDEPLWAQIRLNIGAFLHNLFKSGAFQGSIPREAYFVKCDTETTTQDDINKGIFNIFVGFAPIRPAEFVILKLSQHAAQTE